MTDRTVPKFYTTRPASGRDAFPITNAVTLAIGTLAQLQGGYANHWDDSGQNDVLLGLVQDGDTTGNTVGQDRSTFTGDTSGAPTPDPEVHVDTTGAIITGLASIDGTPSQAKVGSLVYCPDSDLANVDMQASGNTNAIGVLWRFKTTSDCDIKLFTPLEYIAHSYESPGS